jgi:hypothetical protein
MGDFMSCVRDFTCGRKEMTSRELDQAAEEVAYYYHCTVYRLVRLAVMFEIPTPTARWAWGKGFYYK